MISHSFVTKDKTFLNIFYKIDLGWEILQYKSIKFERSIYNSSVEELSVRLCLWGWVKGLASLNREW